MNGLRRSFIVAFGARELTSMFLLFPTTPLTCKFVFTVIDIDV